MLSVRSLRVDYGHVQALRGVDLEAREGEITAIIGSNGAGKTSTLMAISGLAPVTEGEILLRGMPITGRPAHEITTLGITQILEGRQLFADQSVEDNLLLGGYTRLRDRARVRRTMEREMDRFPGGAGSWRARSPAVSSRCSPSRAASCPSPPCC